MGAFKSENELKTIYFSKIEIRNDDIYIHYNTVDVLGDRWREEGIVKYSDNSLLVK